MPERTVLPEASEEILHHFAYSCYSQGHWDKAIRTFRLLLMFCPQNGGYWYGLGSSLMMSGSDEEAASAFQIASIHSSQDPRPLAFWAECIARLGDHEQALRLIGEAEVKAREPLYKAFQEQIDLIKERVITTEVPHER
jgi:Flp pilus assembly protein TadD